MTPAEIQERLIQRAEQCRIAGLTEWSRLPEATRQALDGIAAELDEAVAVIHALRLKTREEKKGVAFHENLSGTCSDEGGVAALYLYVKGLPDKKVEGGSTHHEVKADVTVDWTDDGEVYGIEVLLPGSVLTQ